MNRLLHLQAHALVILMAGVIIRIPALTTPISEGHRNAQTAVLTEGMIENGRFRIDAIAPWRGDLDARLVQELPVFNVTALALQKLPGMELDVSGRATSLLFWIISFFVLQALWRRTLPPRAAFWANLLFIFAPMNWYLSTAFMPESLLQLLAIGFMVFAVDYARRNNWVSFAGLLATGILGMLIKPPGFVHLGLFACLVIADRQGWKFLVRPSLLLAATLIILSLLAWGEYVKEVNSEYFADWSGWANVVGFIRPEASRFSAAYYLPLVGYNLAFVVTLVGAPFVLLGLWHSARTFKTSFVSRLWIYLLLSLAASWLAWGKGAPSQNYYNLPNLVLFCATFATGIGVARRILLLRGWSRSSLRWAATGVAASLMAFGWAGFKYLSRPDKVTATAASWIRENVAGDAIVIFQPRHSAAVMDYQHQPLLSHMTGRRSFVWTRGTPEWERKRALDHSNYIVVTSAPDDVSFLENLRRKFKGEPPAAPDSIAEQRGLDLHLVYTAPSVEIFALQQGR